MLKIFTSNLSLKILALVLAVFLWIFVVNDGFRSDYLDKEVPISAYNLSENLSLASDLGQVKLKVKAPKTAWQEISSKELIAFVDLRGYKEGRHQVEVKASSDDPKVQIIEKEPSKVEVVIEKLASCQKEVSFESEGFLGEGYVSKEALLSQKTVEVKGPQSACEKISKVVARIEFKGEMSEIRQLVELVAFDQEGNKMTNIVIVPKTIDVTVPIEKETNVKIVGIKARITGELSGFWIKEVSISPQTVTISGKEEDLTKIQYLETQDIDISEISSSFERKVGLLIPKGVSAETAEVLVKISLEPEKTSRFVSVSASVLNLSDKFKVASLTPKLINVTMEGPINTLEKLDPAKDISCTLDLAGKGPGTYEIPLTFEMIKVPVGVNVSKIDTEKIKIVIETK